MSMKREVEHILARAFDDIYVETLCGKIIPNPGGQLGKLPAPGNPRQPVCQQCLRKHFNVKRGSHDARQI
jgi:hypothetical protein